MITLTIPATVSALRRAAEMLSAMAHDIDGEETVAADPKETPSVALDEQQPPGVVSEIPPSTGPHFQQYGRALRPDRGPATQEPAPSEFALSEDQPTPSESALSEDQPTPSIFAVDLDADNLPWDVRINSKAKTKLVDGRWKIKRNTSPELISQVHAELNAVMCIEAPAPTPELPAAGPTPAPPASSYAASDVTNFPELMAFITSSEIPMETVTAELQKIGLPGLPLIINKPDLIPILAAALGRTLCHTP